MLLKRQVLKVTSHVCASSLLSRYYIRVFTLKSRSRSVRCNFRNGISRWQISKTIKVVLCIFAVAFTISDILTFNIFDLQKVGQGAEYSFLQWHHLMAMSKCTKYSHNFVFARSHRYWYYHFKLFTLKKYFKVMEYIFCNDTIGWRMSTTRNANFILYNFDFRKGMIYAHDCNRHTHTHTYTHRNGKAHRYRRNLVDLPKTSILRLKTAILAHDGRPWLIVWTEFTMADSGKPGWLCFTALLRINVFCQLLLQQIKITEGHRETCSIKRK